MQCASRPISRIPPSLLLGLGLALPGCSLVLGLGDFREGGTGGGGSGGTGTGGATSSSTTTSTTTGTGGCTAEQTDCSGSCTSLSDDNLNCGKCGKVCDPTTPSASTCAASSCQACSNGRADCDGIGTNACEADLSSDKGNCGKCGHACAGECSASKCQPVVIGTAMAPDLIAVQGGYVFWRDVKGDITRAATDGSNPTKLPISGSFAVNGTHLYSIQNDGVWRVPLAGAASEQFTTDVVHSIAVDAKTLYATVDSVVTPGNTDVSAYDLSTKMTSPLFSDLLSAGDLLPGDGLIFLVYDNKIYKKSLVVGSPTIVASNATVNQGTLRGDASNLYWLSGGNVMTIPTFGADPDTGSKILQPGQFSFALAVDADSVYWSDAIDMVIRKAPKVGGAAVTFVGGQAKVLSIATDDTFVYWTNIFSGSVMKLEKNP